MAAEDVLNLLFLLGFSAYVAYSIRHRRKVNRMFAVCAEHLGIEGFSHTQGSLSGRVRGLALDVRFHAGSKHTPQHTTIDVACVETALVLHLRKQDAEEERAVERGDAIDVIVGDAVFDKVWIVEGAPADRVRHVLANPAIRADLLELSKRDKATVAVEDDKIAIYFLGTEIGPDAIATDRMRLAVALAEAVIADARTPREAGEIDAAGSSYRSAKRVDPLAVEAAQIAELERVRATRAMRDIRIFAIAANSILTASVLGIQLIPHFPSAFLTVPLSGAALLVTLAAVAQFRGLRKRSPGIPIDNVAVGWVMGCWAINLSLAARAIAIVRF